MALDCRSYLKLVTAPRSTVSRSLSQWPTVSAMPWGVDGLTLDPDFPFTAYLARWDEEGRWATTEADDETDGILWLRAEQPTFWAVLDLLY